jgi:hypothetical protein
MQQISQQLGVDQATAEQAVQSALPAMLAGMAGNSAQPEGSTAIQSALGSGGMMGGLGSILAGAAQGGGGGDLGSILGSILGRHKDDVDQDVQQKSGLDSAKTKQLLMILAPIVLAALAKRQSRGKEANAGAQPKLDDVLNKEAQSANPQGANNGGLLGKILAHVQEPRP